MTKFGQISRSSLARFRLRRTAGTFQRHSRMQTYLNLHQLARVRAMPSLAQAHLWLASSPCIDSLSTSRKALSEEHVDASSAHCMNDAEGHEDRHADCSISRDSLQQGNSRTSCFPGPVRVDKSSMKSWFMTYQLMPGVPSIPFTLPPSKCFLQGMKEDAGLNEVVLWELPTLPSGLPTFFSCPN